MAVARSVVTLVVNGSGWDDSLWQPPDAAALDPTQSLKAFGTSAAASLARLFYRNHAGQVARP